MICPKCQFANPESVKFCTECGHILISASKSALQRLCLNEPLEINQRYLPKTLNDLGSIDQKTRDFLVDHSFFHHCFVI
jgi:hypothetical protein